MAISNIMANPHFRWDTWNAPYYPTDKDPTIDPTNDLVSMPYPPDVVGEDQDADITQLTTAAPVITHPTYTGEGRQVTSPVIDSISPINAIGPRKVNVGSTSVNVPNLTDGDFMALGSNMNAVSRRQPTIDGPLAYLQSGYQSPSEENLMRGDILGSGMPPIEDSTPFYDPMQLGPGVYTDQGVPVGDQFFADTLDADTLDAADEDEYIDRIMNQKLMNMYPQHFKQRKERGIGIPSVISTAFQSAKDFVSNLGKRRQDLRDQNYSENEINLIMSNARGKEFVDAGMYDPMATYYNTPSGVKDEFGYNVFAKNYMKPGSSSYAKWSGVTGSKANIKRDADRDRVIKKMKTITDMYPTDVHRDRPTKDITTSSKDITTPSTGYSHPSAGVGAQASIDTSGDFAGKGSRNPWGRAKGGRVRYSNGGIVDLL